jgi:hypothetical protein
MKLTFTLLLIFNLGYAADPTFMAFVKNPDEKTLETFKAYCDKNSVDYDGNGDGSTIIQGSLKEGNINLIRAMIYSIPTKKSRRCSDGASSEAVRAALGNDILLEHPAALIQALSMEGRDDLHDLVKNGGLKFVDCTDKKCKAKKKSFYARKRSVLLNTKLREKYKPIRTAMLKDLKGL